MQKNCQQKFFEFLNVYYAKTHLIKALNSLDSSRPFKQLLQIQKTGGSRELILPENDFPTSSRVNFSKKYPDFGGLETNRSHESQTWIFFQFHKSYIWTQYNLKISAISFEGNILKKLGEKAKKLNFITFWALYFWKY